MVCGIFFILEVSGLETDVILPFLFTIAFFFQSISAYGGPQNGPGGNRTPCVIKLPHCTSPCHPKRHLIPCFGCSLEAATPRPPKNSHYLCNSHFSHRTRNVGEWQGACVLVMLYPHAASILPARVPEPQAPQVTASEHDHCWGCSLVMLSVWLEAPTISYLPYQSLPGFFGLRSYTDSNTVLLAT